MNHKSKFGFQDEGIKKVGLGNLDCEAYGSNSFFWLTVSQSDHGNIANSHSTIMN